ncbi:MAG: hypothetical protein GY789_22575 [Hyphomicrobiales bacterium]|nr:hypothetical protein [Hyphomicrobiales bacterium]MCP4997422.1 hypothetical protein [Hyphomicrobiales bacterium]
MTENRDDPISQSIRDLKRGLLTHSSKLRATSFRKLHEGGQDAVKPLLTELGRIDLKTIDKHGSTPLLAGIATALHDISEAESVSFIEKATSGRIHPVNMAVLQRIGRYRRSNFHEVKFGEIDIYETKSIDQRYRATRNLVRWLSHVPAGDLSRISRIYIIDEDSEQDFLGYYRPYVAVITIVWKSSIHPNIPVQWLFRLSCESTLYHEIGHHKLGHIGGQNPEQEDQANRYARRLMRRAHPWMASFARIFLKRSSKKE